jgi:sugar lactone lactonase YvrE
MTGHDTPDARLVLDARAELGEGPLWDDRRARLLFVDIQRQQIHEFNPITGLDRVIDTTVPVSALALTEAGDWLAAGGQGFLRIDPDTGAETTIARVEDASRRTRMNDGYVDPAGRFWAGTMSLDGVAGQGTLYRLDPGGAVTPVIAPVTTSNGPAWSPDGRLMYYVDTRTRRVDVMDFDVESGACHDRRTFVDLSEGPGRPDGVIVDRDGGVWVGLWLGFAVRRYRADATLDLIVPIPTACATKCAFGGTDLTDLYVTTARGPLDAAARREQPAAGGLFCVRTGHAGQPNVRFRG